MKRIKMFFMLSALIIGIGGAIAGTPKQKADCTHIRKCDSPDYIPIVSADCSGQDNLNLFCLAADSEGTPCDQQQDGCDPN
jgi:hypothetical protein